MNFWFLIFSHEKAVRHNEDDFGWQNPIIYIEKGFKNILTGNFQGLADDMKIGDKVYIYAGKKDSQYGTNGVYGIGEIVDILTGRYDNSHAVINLQYQGSEKTPIISYYDDEDTFRSLIGSARPQHGYTKITKETADELDKLLNNRLQGQ